jgi:hypothetical protein
MTQHQDICTMISKIPRYVIATHDINEATPALDHDRRPHSISTHSGNFKF